MKCPHCGANIAIEDKFCKNCGQENPFAKQHQEDMQDYEKRFERTQKDVIRTTRKVNEISVRIVILCVLLVIGIVFLFMAVNSSRIYRNQVQKNNTRHFPEYSAQMEGYMNNGQYLELAEFTDKQRIHAYDHDMPYHKYNGVIRTAQSYSNCYYDLMRLWDTPTYESDDYYTSRIGNLADDLEFFYTRLGRESYASDEDAQYNADLPYLEDMDEQLSVLLQAYLHLTPEELEELRGMDRNLRPAKLMEKFEEVHGE